MGINYFIKWVEVVPLIKVGREAVIDFIQNHVIYNFGIHEYLTINQGLISIVQKVVKFALDSGIKLLTSTPYHT